MHSNGTVRTEFISIEQVNQKNCSLYSGYAIEFRVDLNALCIQIRQFQISFYRPLHVRVYCFDPELR